MSSDNTTCSTTTGAGQQLFASAINFFAASQCFITNGTDSQYVPDINIFDFIIVGAGSAGSIVANRLSEISDWKILLLEAGSEPPIEADIPYLDTTLYGSSCDWNYVTKGDGVRHQGLKKGAVTWPRGKILGGSSSINAMFHVKARDCDFQTWFNGSNSSWSLENITYYTKKAEDFQDMNLNEDPLIYDTYGHDGPLVVNSFNVTYREITNKVVDSWDNIGMKKVPDTNAATFEGMGLSGFTRVTSANGERQSTYKAYLKPVSNRQNLKIVTDALVTKILLNNDTQAYGVEVDVKGEQKTFFANLEVIVSGGVVNSPQLLMLSGIGPKEHLLSKNISCVVDLPGVGSNLQDHYSIIVPIYGSEPGTEDTVAQNFDVIKYMYNKTGYLAQGSLSDVVAFFTRDNTTSCPEFQSHHFLFWKNSSTFQFLLDAFTDEVKHSFLQYNLENAAYIFTVQLLHPKSTGKIYLNTSSAYDHPIIDANYLSDDSDIKAAVDGINIINNLVDSPYFQSINAFVPRINVSQCSEYQFPSDLYWKCYALNMASTVFHPIGTSKMGPDSKDSVVDYFLKVYGVENLRVIDASIMPLEPSGNTNSPTIMIGEFGSDIVKAKYLGK